VRPSSPWFLAGLSLASSACTLGLDWTSPAVPSDAGTMEDVRRDVTTDRAAADVAPTKDTGAIDTGAVDTGPGPMGMCGGQGERCCSFGRCDNNRVCVATGTDTFVCEPCGGNGQRCCALGLCPSGRFCTQRSGDPTPLCRDCGGDGEQCCFNRFCGSGKRCETRMGAPYPTCN
jgi:hypothetical protein